MMGIADSMRDLSDRIITSHNVRIKALGDLVIDTKRPCRTLRKSGRTWVISRQRTWQIS